MSCPPDITTDDCLRYTPHYAMLKTLLPRRLLFAGAPPCCLRYAADTAPILAAAPLPSVSADYAYALLAFIVIIAAIRHAIDSRSTTRGFEIVYRATRPFSTPRCTARRWRQPLEHFNTAGFLHCLSITSTMSLLSLSSLRHRLRRCFCYCCCHVAFDIVCCDYHTLSFAMLPPRWPSFFTST